MKALSFHQKIAQKRKKTKTLTMGEPQLTHEIRQM